MPFNATVPWRMPWLRHPCSPPLLIVALVASSLLAMLAQSWLPLAGLLGILALGTATVWPRVAAIEVMVLWAGPIATEAASRRVAGVPLDLGDVIVFAALVAEGARRWRAGRPLVARQGSRLFVLPVILFLTVVAVGIVHGLMLGNAKGTASDALFALTALSAYPLFRVAYRDRLRTFVGDIVAVSAVMSILLIVIAVSGLASQFGVSVDSYDTRGVQDTALRVDAPVQRLALLAVLLMSVGAVAHVQFRPWRRLVLLAPSVAAIGISMTRSTWVALLAAVVIAPAFAAPARMVPITLIRRGTTVALAVVLAVGLGTSGALGQYGHSVTERFLSAGDVDVLQDDSYQQRLVEVDKSTRRIREHPIWGIGFPRPYGAFLSYYPANLGIQVFSPRYFIHNSYLGVWMYLGLPGLLALTVLVLAIFRAVVRTAQEPPRDRAVPLAALGALAVLALISTFQTNLGYEPFYVVLAAVFGLVETWLDHPQALRRGSLSHLWSAAKNCPVGPRA